MPIPGWLLPETITVERPTRTDDGTGGWEESNTTVGDVAGRVRPTTVREREQLSGEAHEAQVTHVAYTQTDADVVRGDELVVRGQRLVVTAVKEPSVTGHHYEIEAREVQRASH